MPSAWSTAGSLPSDRLRPAQRPQHPPPKQNKGKSKAQEPPSSKSVRKLQSLAEGVRKSSGREKDPKGGCFCQGEAARPFASEPLNSAIQSSEGTSPFSIHLYMPRLRTDPVCRQLALLRVSALLCGAPLGCRSFRAFCPP